MLKGIVIAALVAMICQSALADPGGKPHQGQGRGGERNDAASSGAALADAVITAAERATIQAYFRDNPSSADPGAALPPGIRKNLSRGKPLPPGIAKKLPAPLISRLPPRPGYVYQLAGSDVVLIEAATGLIADLVRDALR